MFVMELMMRYFGENRKLGFGKGLTSKFILYYTLDAHRDELDIAKKVRE